MKNTISNYIEICWSNSDIVLLLQKKNCFSTPYFYKILGIVAKWNLFLIVYLLLLQRGSWSDGGVHCDRLHAGALEAREDRGRVRPCNLPQSPAKLHGTDRGPVHLHPRRPARGRPLREHRGNALTEQ